jgi:S1-C subfamily serine protease
MSHKLMQLTISVALVLAPFHPLSSRVPDQRHGDSLLSLQTVKAVDYSPAPSDKVGGQVTNSDISTLINACNAYARGLEILPQFREPVATRGESGILVFRKASPSVVMVVTANFKGDKVSDSGLGTGVILDSAGYVLTNWHVVHGYEAGIIFLKPTYGTEPDKNNAYGVKLVAENEEADLALLKIVKPPDGLLAVKLGDLSAIQVAEDIHIIGHPHGQLWSYSTGVISQIRNNYDWQYSDGSKHEARVLQMQTAINPGNSGGPVLDNNANMLGLVAMSEEGQNLNYAVAVDVIKEFVTRAMAKRTRGGASPPVGAKVEQFVGKTHDGLLVAKDVYSNLISYTVHDPKGEPLELLVETTDGELLVGSKPNPFGGFSEWKCTDRSGKSVFMKSSGTEVDLVSARTQE